MQSLHMYDFLFYCLHFTYIIIYLCNIFAKTVGQNYLLTYFCARSLTHDSSVRVCHCFVGPGDSQQVRFDDPRVCKSFLLGCCPHEILASTVSRFVYSCVIVTIIVRRGHC